MKNLSDSLRNRSARLVLKIVELLVKRLHVGITQHQQWLGAKYFIAH